MPVHNNAAHRFFPCLIADGVRIASQTEIFRPSPKTENQVVLIALRDLMNSKHTQRAAGLWRTLPDRHKQAARPGRHYHNRTIQQIMRGKGHHPIGERDFTAKTDDTCIYWLGMGQILLANARINSIGGNDNIGFSAAAVLEMQREAAIRHFFVMLKSLLETHTIVESGEQYVPQCDAADGAVARNRIILDIVSAKPEEFLKLLSHNGHALRIVASGGIEDLPQMFRQAFM